jgi:hypothetical protein
MLGEVPDRVRAGKVALMLVPNGASRKRLFVTQVFPRRIYVAYRD